MKWIDLPPIWLVAFLTFSWGTAQLGIGWSVKSAEAIAGAFMIAAGFALIGLAVLTLAKRRTTVVPHRTPSALVTSGILRFSRNPIYLGDVFILCGASLIWGSWGGLAAVPVFIWVIQRRFILPEEERLRATFGGAFDTYAATVRRWI